MLEPEEEILIPKKVEATENDELNYDDDGYFHGDGKNVALLLFLYMLQGIPLGLTGAIPIILQNRHIDYSDQVRAQIYQFTKMRPRNAFPILVTFSLRKKRKYFYICKTKIKGAEFMGKPDLR